MPLPVQYPTLIQRVEAILQDQSLVGAHVGINICDSSNKVIFGRNAEQRFVPASNQKIITALMAFEVLGPLFRGSTQFWKNGDRVDVRTTGDPSLSIEQLKQVGKKLGIKNSTKIYVNRVWQELGPGWESDDLPWYYAAPTSLFSADHAMFEAFASKGRLEALEPSLGVTVSWSKARSFSVNFDPTTGKLSLKGSLPMERTSLGKFSQPNPFRTAIRALGGTFAGESDRIFEVPPTVEIMGRPLEEVGKECLEKSDNNAAEQLFIMASDGAKDDYSDHASALQEKLLKLVGINKTLIRICDGSGLSRHNQIAPLALTTALNFARSRPYWDAWQLALAKGGEGTLKSRLNSSSFVGKTGTMDATVSLSGYVTTKQGEKLTLSILVNNSLAPASKIREIQDKIVQAVELGDQQNGTDRNRQTALSEIFSQSRNRLIGADWRR